VNFKEPYQLVSPLLPPVESLVADIRDVLTSKWLTNNGRFVRRLEQRMSEVLRLPHVVATCNATLGLMVAIRALGWRGEVITPAFNFGGTVHAIVWAGCTPVLAEVDRSTFNLDPASVDRLLGPQTAGIIAVDTYGVSCDLDALRAVAPTTSILVDSAHALGTRAQLQAEPAARVYSLHPTKTIVAGEGGLICTGDPDLAARMRAIKNFGFERGQNCAAIGLNAKLPELSAILAYHQIDMLDRTIEGRRAWDDTYRKALADVPGICFQEIPENVPSNYQYTTVVIDREVFGRSRDEVADDLRRHHIVTRPYFCPPVHRMDCYAGALRCDDLTWTEYLSDSVLCLPVHPDEPPSIAADIAGIMGSLGR
jgi:dTDP-4-amino-4,6-dideoxygalactose transaminase